MTRIIELSHFIVKKRDRNIILGQYPYKTEYIVLRNYCKVNKKLGFFKMRKEQ